MEFVNRIDELATLHRWWSSRSPRPALVWGRRRVGKTALLQHFVEQLNVPTVFYTGAGEPAPIELTALSRQVAGVLPAGLRDLAARPFENWADALDHLALAAQRAPVLLVLDEFPQLAETTPALAGILRAFLDRAGAGAGTKLRMVLSGSSVRAMWDMQQYRAPLYGRFDETLLVQPFRPHEAALMLPRLTAADRALVYGITGGTPLYLSWWDQDAPVERNLLQLACRVGAPLYTEGRLVLETEASAGEHTGAVLSAIAVGKTRYHEIEDMIGADPGRTLSRLIELRLITQLAPVTEDPRRTRRKIYRISDEFLAFYLGPLSRYRAEIERGLGPSIVGALTAVLDDHMGGVYEEAFRWHLVREANAGLLPGPVVAIGPWWRADGQDQIDAVVLAEPQRTRIPVMVAEAKWAKRVNGSRIRADLARKAAGITDDVLSLQYAVCARNEVTNVTPGLLTYTADDIFGLQG